MYIPDEIDKKILSILQVDGKTSNLDLSKRIALSTASTHDRVKRLERLNIIESYTANISKGHLGFHFQSFVLVKLENMKKEAVEGFIHRIQRIKEITECHKISSDHQWLLKIVARNHQDFDDITTNKLGNYDLITEIKPMPLLSTVKHNYNTPMF